MVNFDSGSTNKTGQIQWSRRLAEQLDAADGKKDGKISASVWNSFLEKMGSNGNRIKNFINIDSAARSFNFYDNKKDLGKVDWHNNWESVYSGMFEHTAESQELVQPQTSTVQTAPDAEEQAPQAQTVPQQATAEEKVQQAKPQAAQVEEKPVKVESEFRTGMETGAKIEIRRIYYADGSIQKQAFVNGEQMVSFYDGKMPTLGELQYYVKNSPFKILDGKFPAEADLVSAGYEKDDSYMTKNGGVMYKNPETGESVVYTTFDKTVEYRNGAVTQHQCYDENGKLAYGSVTVKRADDDFDAYSYYGNSVSEHLFHPPYSSPEGLAYEAVTGYIENIGEFIEENLGMGYDVSREFANVVIGPDSKSNEILSEDGNYKLQIILAPDGSQTRIHSKKQPDGSFKELGTIKLIKYEAPGSLRGYDFKFEGYNNQTEETSIVSGANWKFK